LFTARGQPAAGLVDQGGGGVGEQLVAVDQFEVVGEVVAGLGFGHGGQGVTQRDALVQGGARTEFDPPQGAFGPSAAPVNGATESISRLVR